MRVSRFAVLSLVALLPALVLATGCSNCPIHRMLYGPKNDQNGQPTGAAPSASAVAHQTCPVMGGKAKPDVYAQYEGRRVLFCCPSCIAVFEKNPEKHLDKLPPADCGGT